MFSKTKYPYNSELKKPDTYGNFDLQTIIDNGVLEANMKYVTGPVKKFKSDEVYFKPSTYPSFDGKMLDYYSLIPKVKQDRYPAIIYYHGGGFMFPLQKCMLDNSVIYSKELNARVFVPEYRVSLQVSCDVVLEDCYAMLKFVFEHAEELQVDTNRVILYGDSAGGCLAESVTLMNRDRDAFPLCGQVLCYPVCDNESERYESVELFQEAAWSKNANQTMWRTYLRGGTNLPKYVVPMRNNLSGLPKAYIEPQGIDTLRDEAIAYENKLRASSVETVLNVIPGSYHGFDADLDNALVKRVIRQRLDFMQRCFI